MSANNSFRRFFNAQLKNKIAFNNMKKILKIIGVLITVAIVAIGIYYIANTMRHYQMGFKEKKQKNWLKK